MSIPFTHNSYFKAYTNHSTQKSEDSIIDYVKHHPQYSYEGVVGAKEFEGEYTDNSGWAFRKVVAIPKAAYSALLKTTYHLGCSLLFGLPRLALKKDRHYFKAQLFSAARDLQESYGHLASLFNDSYGQRHIQEAEFHKSCYSYFTNNAFPQATQKLKVFINSTKGPDFMEQGSGKAPKALLVGTPRKEALTLYHGMDPKSTSPFITAMAIIRCGKIYPGGNKFNENNNTMQRFFQHLVNNLEKGEIDIDREFKLGTYVKEQEKTNPSFEEQLYDNTGIPKGRFSNSSLKMSQALGSEDIRSRTSCFSERYGGFYNSHITFHFDLTQEQVAEINEANFAKQAFFGEGYVRCSSELPLITRKARYT